jgi:epoxyqueuosine reductase
VFPPEYRISLHDRIYGCDDCQEVCPVNRLAARSSPPPPALDHGATMTADILGILSAGDDELLRSFGRWYIPDRDPRYLRRNALIVLGNIGEPSSGDVRAATTRAIAQPDPLIRAHAVWAAARLGYRDLIPEVDPHPMVQREIDAAASVPSRSPGA